MAVNTIPAIDARPVFTKSVVAKYEDDVMPLAFGRSFFTEVESNTLEISAEIRRMKEVAAEDVTPGTQGNRNEFKNSTEKLWIPPQYREYSDFTQFDIYKKLFGSSDTPIDVGSMRDAADEMAFRLTEKRNKIERSIEKQCWQVLDTGIVEFTKAPNIDFNRKAASKVVQTGADLWTNSNSNPIAQMTEACNIIRNMGKSRGGTFNALIGESAFGAFLIHPTVEKVVNFRRAELIELRMPQQMQVGGTFHGQIAAGPYRVNIWTYQEQYEDKAGTKSRYLPTNKMIMLPEVTNNIVGYGALPMVVDMPGPEFGQTIRQTQGRFFVGQYVDLKGRAEYFDISSAPLAIPIAIDQIYTSQVVA